MLFRFAVSNHFSLRDLQVLDLTATKLKDENAGLILTNEIDFTCNRHIRCERIWQNQQYGCDGSDAKSGVGVSHEIWTERCATFPSLRSGSEISRTQTHVEVDL